MGSRRFALALAAVGLLSCWPVPLLAQALGTLAHDGPATPEQISLYLPVTSPLSATVATVRYRPTAGSSWSEAHPLHRIRPEFAVTTVADAFAGVITGLTPGVGYTVDVTVPLDGGSSDVQSLTWTTRALPDAAGAPTRTVAAGSSASQIQAALDALGPGDVLELENGTYDVEGLHLNRAGTASQPICVRGATRSGVVIRDPTDCVLELLDASNVVVENLTLEGSGVDSGTRSSSQGIRIGTGFGQQGMTIRRVTIRGVDQGVVASDAVRQILVYDCSMTGNNVWDASYIDAKITWNDDGVRLPGQGNAAFNNTMYGFGDSFAVANGFLNVGDHFYRNDIRMTGDDAFEGDYANRNLTIYDNRVENSMTLVSFDPLYGGPAFVFRNVAINVGRSPYKCNNVDTGHFIYNNTVIRTTGSGIHANWGHRQNPNGAQRAWAYCNNLLIFRGVGELFDMEADGQNPIDLTNNGWYPDRAVWWKAENGYFSSVVAARDSLAPTTPLFGTSTHRHENDRIVESNPFVENIALGSSYLTQITTFYTPALAPGTAPRGGGVAIPGITDGFSGAAPDMGAIITGRGAPVWGDRDIGTAADTVPPAPPGDLRGD